MRRGVSLATVEEGEKRTSAGSHVCACVRVCGLLLLFREWLTSAADALASELLLLLLLYGSCHAEAMRYANSRPSLSRLARHLPH